MRKPNLFIVGAPKAGTTALHHFLKQHPDIFMTEQKELRFFSKDVQENNNELYRKSDKKYPSLYTNRFFKIKNEKEYLKHFEGWRNEKIAGESSPGYFYSKVAAEEIHKFNPDALIIITIREPVARIYSQHSQRLWLGSETTEDFGKALEASPDTYGAKMSEQAQRYIDVFGKDKVKILIYDDFRKDNARVCREVFRFLGVDPSFTPRFDFLNETKVPRFSRLHFMFKFSALTKLIITPEYTLPPRLAAAYTKIRRPVFSLYRRLFTKRQSRPPMDPDLRRELMEKLKPEVEKLSKITGRDLVGLWGYNRI